MTYDFDADHRVWRRAGADAAFGYSDGDETEQRIARAIAEAQDLGVGSPELARAVTDWPSLYHLSPRRPDVLRPVQHLLTGRVLEVGAGCGAITRFLAESAPQVVAVEGSVRRASIAASRVRDLDNVAVYADTLDDLDVEGGFSAITLIGVLEYSRVYGSGPDPVAGMLQRCRDLLAPGGVLVVAIENQHGLKYLAGAPEDHLGRSYIGVEDGYRDKGPVTFGRRELEARLRSAGYAHVDVLYPFPDYKHARSVFTQAGLEGADGPVVDLLRASGAPVQAQPYERVFSEEAAWGALARNGLAPALANSFLVVASLGGHVAVPEQDLVTVYSSDRRRAFAKQTTIRSTGAGLVAARARLHPDAEPPAGAAYAMVLEDEQVAPGRPYMADLQVLLNTPGWTAADVADWARPWYALLQAAAVDGALPADHVDLTPVNINVVDGRLQPFDLEWVAGAPPSLGFVTVRGLYGALSALRSVAPPEAGTPLRVVDLVSAVAAALGLDDAQVRTGLDAEVQFQTVVVGVDVEEYAKHFAAPVLTVRSTDLWRDLRGAEERERLLLARAEQERAGAEERERLLLARAEQERAGAEAARARAAAEAAAMQADRDAVAAALDVARDEAAAARHEVDVMRGSTSWRLSAPVRALGPIRAAVQGPTERRRSLRDKESWRLLASSVRRRGVVGTVRRLQAEVGPPPAREADYGRWVEAYDTFTEADRTASRALMQTLPARPTFAVVVPVYAPRLDDLRRAVRSVVEQVYEDWQLVLVDDASPDDGATVALLRELAAQDPRVRVVEQAHNTGIAGATNAGLAVAAADFVAFLDHDDELAPHALAAVAWELAEHPDADVVYSDEDKIDGEGRRGEPYFKPDFNPELLLAQNYFNHLTVMRAALVTQVGGLRAGFEGAQDHDLVLRAVAATTPERIRHVPHVLYHWRQYAGVRSFSRDQLERSAAAGRRAVAEHLAGDPLVRGVVPHPKVALWHSVVWAAPDPLPAVTVVIPTRDRVELLRGCLEGLLERTDYAALSVLVLDNDSADPETLRYLQEVAQDERVEVRPSPGPFNYSAINNAGVAGVTTPLVLLLNNDIVVRDPDWLTRMVALAHRPGVGAVGARLLYGDGAVQHAGVVLGVGGVAGHAEKHSAEASTGYFGRLVLTQQVSAVTGACLLTWTDLYRSLGGLDEHDLRVAFNDVDLCLKVTAAGHRIVWSAESELFHLESVSRGAETTPDKVRRFNAEVDRMKDRWGRRLLEDPAYSPNLTLEHEDFGLAFPPRRELPWRQQE